MNKFYATLIVALTLAAGTAHAQMVIEEPKTDNQEQQFNDQIKEKDKVSTAYENEAKIRAEKAAIRKERNYFEVAASLQGTLTSFNEPWLETKGGDNSIAAIGTARLLHNFKKGDFEIETKFDAKLGYNRMKIETKRVDAEGVEHTGSEGVWFKNQDEFALSVAPAYKFSKNWSFGAILKFRSQFANGYKAREKQTEDDHISSILAPGYLDISVGFNYSCPKEKFPIKINLSPIAMSATYVKNQAVRDYFSTIDETTGARTGTAYGVDVNRSSLYEGGSSIQIDFDRTFGKKEVIRYRTTLYSFYGWISDLSNRSKINAYDSWVAAGKPEAEKVPFAEHVRPTVRWEHTINIKATKFLTTDFYFQMYYNKAQSSHVQTQTLLAVGLTYTFKNKDKK